MVLRFILILIIMLHKIGKAYLQLVQSVWVNIQVEKNKASIYFTFSKKPLKLSFLSFEVGISSRVIVAFSNVI